jgi:hypothetical protein
MDRSFLAVLAALAIIAVSACSGAAPGATTAGEATVASSQTTTGSDQGGDAGTATKPDPCSLLKPDELKAQLDVDFQPGVLDPISTAGGLAGYFKAYCTWNPQKADVFLNVTVVIYPSGEFYQPDQCTAYTLTDSGNVCTSTPKPATGIGDDAYMVFGSGPGANFAVSFKKSQWYLDMNLSGADWQPTETQMSELAKLAASRVP